MRLALPDRLIPASLDVDGLSGLKQRLDAGANVITSLVPPGQGLAGVAQSSLDIEEGNRTAGSARRILEENELRAATLEEYTHLGPKPLPGNRIHPYHAAVSMLVAVAGGNLQGLEVTYLARKAGWDVLVVDKNANVPASGMCHWFVQQDLREEKNLGALFAKVDLLIPALENDAALAALSRCARSNHIPFAFDSAAYGVSSSKKATDDLFVRSGIPVPQLWPQCSLPVIVKPSQASGSADITIFNDRTSVEDFLEKPKATGWHRRMWKGRLTRWRYWALAGPTACLKLPTCTWTSSMTAGP